MSDMNIELVLGSLRLVIKPDDITVRKSKELKQNSLEIIEDFQKQIEVLKEKINNIFDRYEKDFEKREDESEEEYSRRSKDLLELQQKELDSLEKGDDIFALQQRLLKSLAASFGQGEKVTDDSFESVSIPKMEKFLHEVYSKAKIPAVAELFNPSPKK